MLSKWARGQAGPPGIFWNMLNTFPAYLRTEQYLFSELLYVCSGCSLMFKISKLSTACSDNAV